MRNREAAAPQPLPDGAAAELLGDPLAAQSLSLAAIARAKSDFPYFCATFLQVRARDGSLVPFVLNKSQKKLHEIAEKQLAEKGYVRLIVLKSRKEGISTYVAARYYHQVAMTRGLQAYILGHDDTAKSTLFNIVRTFHDNSPLAPSVGSRNESELTFDVLGSGYRVGIAGQKAGKGRSMTIHKAHSSECAFWDNAKDHIAAINGAIPRDAPNTEVIFESTANGPSGEFFERWGKAVAGQSEYIPVFFPWFESDYNRLEPEPGFERTVEEKEYAELYGLDDGQAAFMRAQVSEMGIDLFHQEFPATPELAFSRREGEGFMDLQPIYRARKANFEDAYGAPVILGIDPASMGGDRFAICARKGNKVLWIRHRNKVGQPEALAWIKEVIDETKPVRVNIDGGNIGTYLIAALTESSGHLARTVRCVNFGSPSQFKMARPHAPGPVNRRAEMWSRVKDWLAAEQGADIPDDEGIQADLLAPKREYSGNDFLLESKKNMKARGVRSPDLADALALTFASEEYFDTAQKSEQPAVAPAIAPQTGHDWSGETSWMGY